MTFWSELVYQSMRLASAKAMRGSMEAPATAPVVSRNSRRFIGFPLPYSGQWIP